MHTAMIARTNTTACRVIETTPRIENPSLCAIPLTMASTIMPSTSSMTAAAMMILASRVSMRLRSLMILAVMPTDVATIAAPRNRAWLVLPSVAMMSTNPITNGTITPNRAQKNAAFPDFSRSETLVSRPTMNSRKITPSSARA